METADFTKMEQIRAQVGSIVEDPATAEALKPCYRQFCKRPCFHDEYLQTIDRGNVTLVDTRGAGVERVTEKGVVVAGEEYELDCPMHATGFEVGTDFARRAGYLSIAQSGFTVNFPYMTNEQAKHIAYIVERALDRGIRSLEVSEQAEAEWVATVSGMAERTAEFSEQCTPGCYNNEGQPGRASRQSGFYFGGPREFVEILEAWRADGGMKGLELG
jgi:cyclohexanone monooxygenase